MEPMRLVEKAIELAKKKGIKQGELARLIGAYPSRMSEWKSDEGKPSIEEALRMARVVGTTLDYLADDEATEPPNAAMTEWQRKVWEIVLEIGPERAWRRLVGVGDENFGEGEPPKKEAPKKGKTVKYTLKQRSKTKPKSKPGGESETA